MDLFLLQPGDSDILYGGDPMEIDGLPPKDDIFDPSRCVPLISFGQSLQQRMTGDTARTSGTPTADFTLVRPIDSLSVRLYEFCMEARPLGAGHDRPTYLHMLRDLDGPAPLVMTVSLRDALVSGIQLQSRPDGPTTELITLNVTEVLWLYRLQGEGRPGTLRTGWSVAQGKPLISFT
jgi:type VI secretion system secreted protein Hcp